MQHDESGCRNIFNSNFITKSNKEQLQKGHSTGNNGIKIDILLELQGKPWAIILIIIFFFEKFHQYQHWFFYKFNKIGIYIIVKLIQMVKYIKCVKNLFLFFQRSLKANILKPLLIKALAVYYVYK